MDDHPEVGTERRYLSLADCEICSQLDEVVASFTKYGWEDQDVPLPRVTARLGPTETITPYDAQLQQVRRCPVCGIYYAEEHSYEYLVNGSEEEDKLTRLTPAQACRLLDAETYEFLMSRLSLDLAHSDAATRRYAGKCWVSHHLERGEIDGIACYLQHADAEVVKGALFFLWRLLDDWWWQTDNPRIACLVSLKDVFQALTQHPDSKVSTAAPYLIQGIDRVTNLSGTR
jgi:hypothetical protein